MIKNTSYQQKNGTDFTVILNLIMLNLTRMGERGRERVKNNTRNSLNFLKSKVVVRLIEVQKKLGRQYCQGDL